MDEFNNGETLPNESLNSNGGNPAGSEVVEVKDLLGAELGKDFPTNEAALKAVKDTFKYVGEVGKYKPMAEKLLAKYGSEDAVFKALETPNGDYVPREQYEADRFFESNPQLAPHKEVITAMKKQTGKSLDEVVKLDSLKTLIEKANNYDSTEKSKSVLYSSSRLGQATDRISQAQEAMKSGNQDAANAAVTKAVIDAFELE